MSTPTLIIGLGGAGLQIVRRVHRLASDKQRKNLSFVVFDTDANELRALEEAKLGIHTIQISTSLTVGEYLQQDHNARDRWFPVNRVLNSKLMTDGAGQVRAISRLAFNTALVQGKLEPLDDAIGELYRLRGERLDQAPRIIITGSLCGGTGSGLCLPVALYTRNYLETRVQQGASIVRGFFMLPETFFDVITGISERNNLRCNAYAALREIDSFMMKADGNLPEEYDLHFTIPRVNTRREDEYTGRPMDFCFLFDGQNMNGQSMNSREDYLDHAANCIYGMAIAPTSSRSNSSEDNVIRDIMAQKGRNRYAGAGTSMLIYPTEAVKRYLSLCWTDNIVSNDWVKIDRAFAGEVENNRMRRNSGVPEQSLNRGKHYLETVDNESKQNMPFARAIRTLCTLYEDANKTVETHSCAKAYVKGVYDYVMQESDDAKKPFEKTESTLSEGLGDRAKEVGDLSSHITEMYKKLMGWRQVTDQCTENCAQTVAYTLFKDPSDFTYKRANYRIENWIYGNEGFIHPSAMRYFVYDAYQEIEKAYNKAAAEVRGIRDKILDQEQVLFDVESTEKVERALEEFLASGKLKRGLFNRLPEEAENILGRMLAMKTENDKLWESNVTMIVYKNAMEYLKALSEAFETFYDAIDRNTVSLHEEARHLENKFAIRDGKPIRYVCADKECLHAMREEVVNKHNTLDLPSELNRKIYMEMRKLAMQTIKDRQKNKGRDENGSRPTANRFCISVFDETIVKFMAAELEDEYDVIVNMDVLSALEKEAQYRNANQEMTDESRRSYIEHYMTDVIQSTERLASPFIETPRHHQPRMIQTCTYSSQIVSPDIPIAGRLDFVHEHLPNGVVSDGIEPDMILFYQAVYAIEASELGKFAPAEKTKTTDKQAGDYFKAYHALVETLHPNPQASRSITPHLDRWWHLVTRTPDLSEAAHQEQKKDIMRALLWGLLGRFVIYCKDKRTGRQYYKRSNARIQIEGETDARLIVSNGTTCDHLYEVQDAMTIYPDMVYTILRKVREQIERNRDNNYGMKLDDTYLYKLLNEFRVSEYPLRDADPAKEPRVRSIFELPLLVKRSTPADLYNNADMLLLLQTIIDELYDYHVSMFQKDSENTSDMVEAYDKLIMDQFDLMMENLKLESKQMKAAVGGRPISGDIEADDLKDEILEYLIKEVEDHGIPANAARIEEKLVRNDDDE